MPPPVGRLTLPAWKLLSSIVQKEEIRPMEVRHDFETLETAVRRHLVDALALAHGNLRQAAELLGVSRWKLARMVEHFELRDLVATMRSEGEHVRQTPAGEGAPETARCGHDG
jgi:DNA-binding MarR family transcriptional regulator